jgi:uncharacterized protein YcgI (DUF1989 family)
VVRIIAVEGPQVCDLNLWHRDNPRERFWAADPVAHCRPLGVEVYDLDEELLEGWTPPQPVRVKSVYEVGPDG